jgi:long-chain acyl-CoA synthetase
MRVLSGEKPWSKYWPPHAPRDVESLAKLSPQTVGEVLRQHSGREGCALIQADGGLCVTWRRLWEIAWRVGGWLRSKGCSRGCQVVVASENRVEAILFSMGVMASGARAVLVDPLTVGEDLKFQLEGREIAFVAGSPAFLARNRSVIESLGLKAVELSVGEPASGLKEVTPFREPASNTSLESLDDVEPDDDAFSVYYAGIAGRTMQAIHSQRGLVLGSIVYASTLGLDAGTPSLMAAPFTHVLGLQACLLAPLTVGAPVLVMSRWNAALARSIVESGDASYMAGVPLMYKQLLDSGASGGLKIAVSAGAPLPRETAAAFRERFGVPLLQAYGMSESLILTLQTHALSHVEGTIGVPLPGVDVKLVDSESGVEIPLGSTGELLVKAPWVMKGYEFPEENEKAFINGWLRTGDIVEVRGDGVMFFRGVRKRIIKYKGYAILPRDLEVILESHPDVVEARVYGEPAGDLGEVPVARVKVRRGSNVTERELLEYVNSRVAFYKKLRKVDIEVEG